MDLPEKQQQFPELNSSRVQQEALVTATDVQQMLKLVGQVQSDGSTTYDSTSFHFAQQGEIVTVTTKDNHEVLRVEGDIIVFNPTGEDRLKLQELRQKVENILNRKQQRGWER